MAHNHKVVGSSPTLATIYTNPLATTQGGFFWNFGHKKPPLRTVKIECKMGVSMQIKLSNLVALSNRKADGSTELFFDDKKQQITQDKVSVTLYHHNGTALGQLIFERIEGDTFGVVDIKSVGVMVAEKTSLNGVLFSPKQALKVQKAKLKYQQEICGLSCKKFKPLAVILP